MAAKRYRKLCCHLLVIWIFVSLMKETGILLEKKIIINYPIHWGCGGEYRISSSFNEKGSWSMMESCPHFQECLIGREVTSVVTAFSCNKTWSGISSGHKYSLIIIISSLCLFMWVYSSCWFFFKINLSFNYKALSNTTKGSANIRSWSSEILIAYSDKHMPLILKGKVIWQRINKIWR